MAELPLRPTGMRKVYKFSNNIDDCKATSNATTSLATIFASTTIFRYRLYTLFHGVSCKTVMGRLSKISFMPF
jgi:hypothetical protein